ncbi:hypothetical protein PABG_11755 [Paracoccidioides brasiliensis Pb03]|nr:hypothetical protein PABG_11755 [Paracoccidioides brasiliensis Pb03]
MSHSVEASPPRCNDTPPASHLSGKSTRELTLKCGNIHSPESDINHSQVNPDIGQGKLRSTTYSTFGKNDSGIVTRDGDAKHRISVPVSANF